MKYRLAVIDDEVPNLESLERILKSDGAAVKTFSTPYEALEAIRQEEFDVVLTDLRMTGLSGLELLKAIKLENPMVEVVLMTAYGTVPIAVEAMKEGAYDFITKPLQKVSLLKTIHRALDRRSLVKENYALREKLKSHSGVRKVNIVGHSSALRRMLDIADQAAQSRATVLIQGESGTGKGVLAQYLHQSSKVSGAFVPINCAAIPENLLEAELFGYEPGAFTGAGKQKKGRVELAEGGTLFLDEIALAPTSLQAKLLRFVQEGEFERLGATQSRSVDTRIVSATNTDLIRAISEGKFRQDLFYRLNVILIHVPSLREREEDIPILAHSLLTKVGKKNDKPIPIVHPEVIEALRNYRWPGNIRELENLMESLVVLNRSGEIRLGDLPIPMSGKKERPRSITVPLGVPLRQVEKIVMDETLKSTQGNRTLAAKMLGVSTRTIYRHSEQEAPLISPEPKEETTV